MTGEKGAAAYSAEIVLGLMAGLGIGLFTVAIAAMIFAGPLTPNLPLGMALLLVGGGVALLVIALLSRLPTMLTIIQDKPGILTASIAASYAAVLTDPQVLLSTTVATMALGSFASGVAILLFYRFRLTFLVQYLPYPVIGGFLAGTGWLLFDAGFFVTAQVSPVPGDLERLVSAEAAVRWAPALAAGLVLYTVSHRYPGPLTVPGLFLAIVALFYGTAALNGVDHAALQRDGWVFGPFAGGNVGRSLASRSLASVDYAQILAHAGMLFVIVFLTLITALIYLTGVEIAVKREIGVDWELRNVGIANLCVAAVGSTATFPSIAYTSLFTKQGARTRLMAIVAGVFMLAVGVLGPAVLNYAPKMAFGAVVFLIALDFFVDWLWKTARQMVRAEYVILTVIFLTVVLFGFLEAIALGILVCVVFFALTYSSLSHIRKEGDARAETDSVVWRLPAERLRRIDAEAPGEAALIHKLVARTMSWRVAHLSDELRAVLSRKDGPESPLGEGRVKRW